MKNKIMAGLLFFSCFAYAHSSSYLYDQNGKPIFVKVPEDRSLLKKLTPLIELPILVDESGPFFASMILFNHWICPYCGILNQAEVSNCIGENCPISTKT